MRKFTTWEKIKLALGERVYMGELREDGWEGSLPLYAFWCDVHGIVENVPHGKGGIMCRECIDERCVWMKGGLHECNR